MRFNQIEIGEQNKNKQILMRKTPQKSTTHPFALIWVMRCSRCNHEYGCNGCDAHERRCPQCNPDVNPGEPIL